MNNEQYIDHETRVRLLEESIKSTKESLQELGKDMKSAIHHLDNKIDNQFKWIIATIITLFGGVVLHMAKLI